MVRLPITNTTKNPQKQEKKHHSQCIANLSLVFNSFSHIILFYLLENEIIVLTTDQLQTNSYITSKRLFMQFWRPHINWESTCIFSTLKNNLAHSRTI